VPVRGLEAGALVVNEPPNCLTTGLLTGAELSLAVDCLIAYRFYASLFSYSIAAFCLRATLS